MRKSEYSDNTVASNPGNLPLSKRRLRKLGKATCPLLARLFVWRRLTIPALPVDIVRKHLIFGDSCAASVMSVDPLFVAAYSDELDCVAMLRFPVVIGEEYDLRVGSRLLTINMYGFVPQSDLVHGERSYHRYQNFHPLIADFLTDDFHELEARKRQLPREQWDRCFALGREYFRRPSWTCRHGWPLFSAAAGTAATPEAPKFD